MFINRKGKHFIVYIDRGFCRSKGTPFLINQEQANISKVPLFSGKVDFTIVGTEHTIEMKPSQRIDLQRGEGKRESG